MTTTTQRTYKGRINAARAWAKRNGVEGRSGGWIYFVGGRRPICQGWGDFAQRLINSREIAPVNPKDSWHGPFVIAEG
jgi:hypothetical protein